ncbi:cytochrome P450 [Amycolatopsis circi]|uniref:cytochrome P450 n=1 Tax=Amycolatopsis circi TaxID=871959 RepID=UPI000E27653A|nr:cytochrome P450 [Amycolatopsis circi]
MTDLDGLTARYDDYREFRRTKPVTRGEDGCWHVYRHEDVKRVINDHERFSAKVSFGANLLGETMMRQDPPEHRRLRALANHAFTPRRIAALGQKIAELAAERLADRAAGLDVVAALAAPLPVMVIAEILGVEPHRHEDFKRWSEIFMSHDKRPDQAEVARLLGEMRDYVAATIERRRRKPGDALIDALIHAEVDGGGLTTEELVAFCYLLLVAGNETTHNLIANTVICLAWHPEALAELRADRTLVPAAVEEANRYLSPVQILVRVTRAEVRLGDAVLPPGERVFAYLGSANRDEEQFASPDRYDLHRREPHLGFGHGVHYCLGAPLGRLAAKAAVEALLDHLPGEWTVADRPVRQVPAFFLCGVTSLPLVSR